MSASPTPGGEHPRRILLLLATTSYRAEDFLDAAGEVGVSVTVASDHEAALETEAPGGTLEVDFSDLGESVEAVSRFHREQPLSAVVAAEDEGTVLAAAIGEALGLRHNPVSAVRACRRKDLMRERLRGTELLSPWFQTFPTGADPSEIVGAVSFPCVIKPVALAASRGVIRADDAAGFVKAFERVARIVAEATDAGDDPLPLLVESYVPGREVALEGLLDGGSLRPLALLDKPEPLEGPFFEETSFVTPSRLPPPVQGEVERVVGRAAERLGLRDGPVHAELRLNDDGAWLLELAPRTIGGLCARIFRYRSGASLEEVVIRHALGEEVKPPAGLPPSGVMMIPIPRAGRLVEVPSLDRALEVEGVEDIEISAHRGQELVPLPEGNRYLGFIFARADSPEAVERALNEAHARLEIEIEPLNPAVSSG